MYGDGVTRVAPVKTLEITTNFKNGEYNGEGESLIAEFGSSASSYYDKYMDIPTIRNTQTTNGLILAHRNANDQSCFVRVNCDSNGDRFFRPLTGDGNISLGSGSFRWKSIYSVDSLNVSSDRNLKENIKYICEVPNQKALINEDISISDMYEFVKNDLYLSTYNFKGSDEEKIGFIAQDIVDTKIGDKILSFNRDESTLGYDTSSYTNVIVGALQQAIKKIEDLEEEIKTLKNK